MKTKIYVLYTILCITILFAGCEISPDSTSPGDEQEEETSETFTVTYDSNGAEGGSVPEDGSVYEEGDPVTVLDNSGNLVLTGHTFARWNTTADGTGTGYNAGSVFSMGSADVLLYAQWNPITPPRYCGGYLARIYNINTSGGGNDQEVTGFDNAILSFTKVGAIFYYLADVSGYKIYAMDAGGADTEITGFDYLDYDSKIYKIGADYYYTGGLNLYQMVTGAGNDILQTGFDYLTTTDSNGPFYKWDGTDWYYYTEQSSMGIYRRVGTEANETGSNDVLLGDIEGTSEPSCLGMGYTTDLYYKTPGSAQGLIYKYISAGDDTLIEGFDVSMDRYRFLYDGADMYYTHNNTVYRMVSGYGDDSELIIDSSYPVRYIYNNGNDLYYLANSEIYKYVPGGTDEGLTGIDNVSNLSSFCFDGDDLYYVAYDSVFINDRAIYQRVGTEANTTGNNDVYIGGFDNKIRQFYFIEAVTGDVYYSNGINLYMVVGSETPLTGSNDTLIGGFDNTQLMYCFAGSDIYYQDSGNNIYLYNETATDTLVIDGSVIDGNIINFIYY
jgi:hypothetical protein